MKKKKKNIEEALLFKILEQTANEKERTLFKSWLEASAENAATFQELKKINRLKSINPRSKQKNWESIRQKIKSGKEVPAYIELPDTKILSFNWSPKRLIRIAAMLLFLLGTWFLFQPIVFDSGQLIVSGNNLKPNEPYQLADGSLVYLNGNSEISFSKAFGKEDRKITLKGEGYFEVQKNEHLPFSISTYQTTIQVLGTSFNVYSDYSEQVKVSVVSGVVAFFSAERKNSINLKAGDLGTYDPRLAMVTKENIDNQNFLAWRTGILSFNETPLSEAVQAIQKQYSRVLVFELPKNEITPTLTTTFDNQPLEAVLEELTLLFNVHQESRNDTIFFKPKQ